MLECPKSLSVKAKQSANPSSRSSAARQSCGLKSGLRVSRNLPFEPFIGESLPASSRARFPVSDVNSTGMRLPKTVPSLSHCSVREKLVSWMLTTPAGSTSAYSPVESSVAFRVQYPAQKSEHRFNFFKPPIGGREGRRGDGHIGQGWVLRFKATSHLESNTDIQHHIQKSYAIDNDV
ncbi:hypothetical protein OUZ56_011680 [Daphnia magna]|uniref:Uncharacterized protein n=1 Tax=Daphnia magna TaxID=35525 RepID=A0ABQ9Z0V0_9CRUS|nr:hypothetical protein OUZ56_011680 [Daphnia magna]